MKKLIAVSLIAILVSGCGCGKSSIPQSEPELSPLFKPPSFESLHSMTPLDYNSEADNDFVDYFFKFVTTGTIGVSVVREIVSLINGTVTTLSDVVNSIFWNTGVALVVASILFLRDKSYKNSYWYNCVMLAGFNIRAYLADGHIGFI